MDWKNPLDRKPQARGALYDLQWFLTGIQTVLSALFAFMYGTPDDWPVWFLASLSVLPVLWAYLGLTAKQNVSGNPDDPYRG